MEQPKFEHCHIYEGNMEYNLGQFLSGEFRARCHTDVMPLQAEFAFSEEPEPFENIPNLTFQPIQVGGVWSKTNFACAWFHVTGKLPEGIDRKDLYLDFSNDGEGLLVDKDGSAVKGFTAGSPIFNEMGGAAEKRYFPLDGLVDKDGNIDLYIDAASNSILGEFKKDALLLSCAVVRRNTQMLDLYWDFDVLYELMKRIPRENEKKMTILFELRKVMNLIVYDDPDYYAKGKAIMQALYALEKSDDTQVTAVGHAHLDLAWLWPIRESKRKAKRTFSNALYLLRKYPDFHFVVSQPQQLEWMKRIDPKLYQELLKYMKEGRLEPVGGGWVENDTNLPCEESLVRQELYGQKFWQEELGSYVNLRWLPDTFGYSACMPQVLQQSAQDSFMTIKLSWSNRTIFPYHSFRWAGIDGTEVCVHMPPEGTYNSHATALALMRGKWNLRPEDPKEDFLMVYGIGDGGGGPSEIMVQRCLRQADAPTLPKVKMATARSYFDTLKTKELPLYNGEMYLEKHRGTYTSESNNKNFNREFEGKMLSYETLLSCSGKAGDKSAMDEMWKEALLYQFHDIIPGSSIRRVYDETDAAYKILFERLEKMANEQGATFVAAKEKALMNFSGKPISKIVKSDGEYLYYCGNQTLIAPTVYALNAENSGVERLETDYYTINLDKDGSFRSIFLKENGKTVLESANQLCVFIDRGDAWDFEDDYRDQPKQYMTLNSTTVRIFGDITEITQAYSYKESRLTQTVVLHKSEPLIQIKHDVDWKNTGYMLRAEFLPKAWSDTAHSDIQFGYLARPTTDGTEHDAAQFETCCQKWLDISNDEMGFALVNNAKSGFMAKQGIVSLNLLRSTNYPDHDSEQKPIHYEYALYPHAGGFDPVKVDDLASDFNARCLYGNAALEMPSVDNGQVLITAFKPAYDGNGYILRMFERTGKAAETSLKVPSGYRIACEVNLLEDRIGEADKDLQFKPFEIRSFRLVKA